MQRKFEPINVILVLLLIGAFIFSLLLFELILWLNNLSNIYSEPNPTRDTIVFIIALLGFLPSLPFVIFLRKRRRNESLRRFIVLIIFIFLIAVSLLFVLPLFGVPLY